jgi:hypothetical protein
MLRGFIKLINNLIFNMKNNFASYKLSVINQKYIVRICCIVLFFLLKLYQTSDNSF